MPLISQLYSLRKAGTHCCVRFSILQFRLQKVPFCSVVFLCFWALSAILIEDKYFKKPAPVTHKHILFHSHYLILTSLCFFGSGIGCKNLSKCQQLDQESHSVMLNQSNYYIISVSQKGNMSR